MASRGDIKFEEVQPKLNENWLTLDFEKTLSKTGSFTKLKSKEYFDKGEFPVIDQGDSFISGYINNEELLYQGELPVVIFGDHTRVVKFIDFKFATGADGTKVLKPIEIFDEMFYFYYLKSLKIPSLGYSRHFKILKEVKVPVPPVAEQQRIVAKLDTLFGKLETLKTSLNNIPKLLKNFRQAILTQAVTGKFTEEWRKGKELGKWEETELINLVLQKPRNGYSPAGVDYITDVKSLSLSATTAGKFNALKVKYLDIEKPENDSHLWLKKGDILIQRSNSLDYVGTSAIYDGEDDDFMYPDIMMKIQVNEKIINSYMNYVLSSSKVRTYYKDNATGTAGNMPKINQVVVSNTPIYYPPKEEQIEIVKRVEHLFTKADAIEEQYQTLKSKIDSLPQAILAKAFKGELVPQLLTDGDAKELLKKIQQLKAETVKKPKKRAKPKPKKKKVIKISFETGMKDGSEIYDKDYEVNVLGEYNTRIFNRVDTMVKSNLFTWLLEQPDNIIFDFDSLKVQVDMPYQVLSEQVIEFLDLTSEGMRPGIKRIYENDKMIFRKII